MSRSIILALGYVGAVLFFLAGAWALFNLEFVCLGGCKPVDVPNRVVGLLPRFAPFLVPGIVLMTIAWIFCLVLLRRAHWQGWFRTFRTVLAVPMLIFGVSAISLIITWSVFAQTSMNYRTVAEGSYPVFFVTVRAAILLTLVSNLFVIIAGHVLHRATPKAAPARG